MKTIKVLIEIASIPVMVLFVLGTFIFCGLWLMIKAVLDRPEPKEDILKDFIDKKLAINSHGKMIVLDEIEYKISS